MFELGEIWVKEEKGKCVIKQQKGEIDNTIREYSKFEITTNTCKVCLLPDKNQFCHRAFEHNDNLTSNIPQKVITCGYYKKNEVHRLTEDMNRIRSLNNCDDLDIDILAHLAASSIKQEGDIDTKAVVIPSRQGQKPCLSKLI